MKFQPILDEEIAGNAHISNGPYDFAVPGSEWGGPASLPGPSES
jgi:hypothetical protein